MSKIRVGVFGGHRGFSMIKQLLDSNDAVLVAVCDKYQPVLDKVKKAAEKVNLPVALYNNFDDFLTHDMDAVVLANYATEHVPFALRCLEAGKHVMSELLPSETPAQAVELIEAVERTGLVYAYAENCCYMKAPFEMWRRYRRGDIGEVVYCEGEYIHDCSAIWPAITYGDPNHWRNRMYATFYCTHSLGPMLTITGLRPVSVVGFETNLNDTEKQIKRGCCRTAGIEMVTLENGAVCKSIHGDIKREPYGHNYQIYGKTGMMESARFNDHPFNIYKENPDPDIYCEGEWEKYDPQIEIGKEEAAKVEGHGGSDFYSTYFFIQKILGRPDGEWSIDVYTAVDMGLCGILAYRSILSGNQPIAIPNFRNKEERDAWRHDNACTNPDIAGDALLPRTSKREPAYAPDLYDYVADLYRKEQEKAAEKAARLPSLYLKKSSLDDLPTPQDLSLPTGISLVSHQTGEEKEWEALIERCFDSSISFEKEISGRAGWEPSHTLYLVKDGKKIATATGINFEALPEGGWLHYVAVDPDFRGMGLAKLISLAALCNLKERGYNEVGLYTNDERIPAIKTYLRLGFRPMMTHESHKARWEKIMDNIEKGSKK